MWCAMVRGCDGHVPRTFLRSNFTHRSNDVLACCCGVLDVAVCKPQRAGEHLCIPNAAGRVRGSLVRPPPPLLLLEGPCISCHRPSSLSPMAVRCLMPCCGTKEIINPV